MTPRIDAARLQAEIDRLATFNATDAPAVERVLYTDEDLQGRAYVRALAAEAGLQVRVDAIGNAFYRLEGEDPTLPAIGTGSHIDAIPGAGKYDGTVGVLGGIAALRALGKAGRVPPRPLEVVAFTSEEPTRFGLGCIGSRMMAGALGVPEALALRDEGGRPFDEVRRAAGFEGSLESVRLGPNHYAAFVELHVEQGPLLEAAGVPIGAVTAIAAPASYMLRVRGEGGHAGAVLMEARRDAFTAACEIALAVEDAARESGSRDTVATCGVCKVHPCAVNSIPSEVQLTLDLRDTDLARREEVFGVIRDALLRVRETRAVEVALRTLNADPPALSTPRIVEAVEGAASALGLGSMRMVSRAYHDTLFLSRIAPVGMIFVPSRGGISHRPDEHTDARDIAQGAAVLAETLWDLAANPPPAEGGAS